MTVCRFFLEGRCHYGDRCWNEHPRGGGRNQGQYQPQHAPGGRNWNSQAQQYQPPPPTYSKSMTWTNKSRDGGFKSSGSTGFPASQNRFSTLSAQDHEKDSPTDKDANHIDEIIRDMEIWQPSGQWVFSVYSVAKEKCNISGFSDISPEELRLEYNASQAKGTLQNYMSSLQQMVNSWKQRIHELMNLNASSRATLLNELAKPSDQTPAFGGQQQPSFGLTPHPAFGSSGLGSSNAPPTAATFSFKVDSDTAQNTIQSATTVSAAGFKGFGAKPSSTFGFPVTNAPSASTFSFAATTSSTAGTSVFGFSTAPSIGANSNQSVPHGFGASSSTSASGFGGAASTWGAPSFGGNIPASVPSGFGGFQSSIPASGFGSQKTTAVSDQQQFKSAAGLSVTPTSIIGSPSVPPTNSTVVNLPPSVSAGSTSNALFSPRADLSAEDVFQFEAKVFTLGKIPLWPPPADLIFI